MVEMSDWVTFYTEVTTKNGNIADSASEYVRPTEEGHRQIRMHGSFNWWLIQETLGTALTITFDEGTPRAREIIISANSNVAVEPEEGEYYTELKITNNSGAQYNANGLIVNRAIKKLK